MVFSCPFSAKEGKHNGENHYERAGTGISDGDHPSQSIQAGKTAGFPCDPCREQNPHPRRGIQGMAAEGESGERTLS